MIYPVQKIHDTSIQLDLTTNFLLKNKKNCLELPVNNVYNNKKILNLGNIGNLCIFIWFCITLDLQKFLTNMARKNISDNFLLYLFIILFFTIITRNVDEPF